MLNEIKFETLDPTYPEADEITKEDVWGKWSETKVTKKVDGTFDVVESTKIHSGMIVADCRTGGYNKDKLRSTKKCPIFKTFIDWKSVTVVCDESISEEVAYWLEYVQGCDCISKFKKLEDGKVAFRADYMAW